MLQINYSLLSTNVIIFCLCIIDLLSPEDLSHILPHPYYTLLLVFVHQIPLKFYAKHFTWRILFNPPKSSFNLAIISCDT